jgi:hypothetical protein
LNRSPTVNHCQEAWLCFADGHEFFRFILFAKSASVADLTFNWKIASSCLSSSLEVAHIRNELLYLFFGKRVFEGRHALVTTCHNEYKALSRGGFLPCWRGEVWHAQSRAHGGFPATIAAVTTGASSII